MELPTIHDGDLMLRPKRLGDVVASQRVAEKAGFRDTGELRGAPCAGVDEPVQAVYAWIAG